MWGYLGYYSSYHSLTAAALFCHWSVLSYGEGKVANEPLRVSYLRNVSPPKAGQSKALDWIIPAFGRIRPGVAGQEVSYESTKNTHSGRVPVCGG